MTEQETRNGEVSQAELFRRVDRLCDRLEDHDEKVERLCKLMEGNGEPEKGVVLRLDRIEQSAQRLRRGLWTAMAAAGAGIAKWVYDLLHLMGKN